jgi:hypothetical protein
MLGRWLISHANREIFSRKRAVLTRKIDPVEQTAFGKGINNSVGAGKSNTFSDNVSISHQINLQ